MSSLSAVLAIVLLIFSTAALAGLSEFDIALGRTAAPTVKPLAFEIKSYRYDVPLENCMRIGEANEFQLEWQLHQEPQNTLEIRFTADSTRGFTGLGFAHGDSFQIVSGNPITQLPCARSLYDTVTAYELDGSAVPNYPELPANLVIDNTTHAVHYAMRNISVTAARMLRNGATMTTNVTLLWAYMQSSLFKSSCYLGSVDKVTEMATFQLILGDGTYSSVGGACNKYTGKIQKHLGHAQLNPTRNMLAGERDQSTRVALLLFGGDLLVRSGRLRPVFDAAAGSVTAGENRKGVCQSSLSTLKVYWSGFSDTIGGITDYIVSAGTKALPYKYIDRVSAFTNQAFTQTSLTLPKNTSFIVTVTAYNFATQTTSVTSKPILILNGGSPMFGQIYDGPRGYWGLYQYQKDTTQLEAYWVGWTREDYCDKDYYAGSFTDNGYQYAIGLKGGALNSVTGWVTRATFEETKRATGLTLLHGQKYTFSVRTTNCAGATTLATTPGVLIDIVAPIPGVVLIGNSTRLHRPYIMLGERISATWHGFVDSTSGVKSYSWAMSTHTAPPNPLTNSGLAMGWVDVGLLQFGRNGTLAHIPATAGLTVGTTIYVHVRAVDRAGNWIVSSSNGTLIAGF
jgi:hypothetical protein